jgi:hypothetical protein
MINFHRWRIATAVAILTMLVGKLGRSWLSHTAPPRHPRLAQLPHPWSRYATVPGPCARGAHLPIR